MSAILREKSLVQQFAEDRNHCRKTGYRWSLDHLEPDELVRHVIETRHEDIAECMANAMEEMQDRKRLIKLVEQMVLEKLTEQEQAELNALIVNAMVDRGLRDVREALEKQP